MTDPKPHTAMTDAEKREYLKNLYSVEDTEKFLRFKYGKALNDFSKDKHEGLEWPG